MPDHLSDARACAYSASQAPDAGTTISWLTATCEQILDHLEAQQTSQQPATAPPAAQQGDSGHRDGGEAVQAAMAVLCDEGADSEGSWHSWRCFDRERYPEPCDCTERVARAAIAAAEPHIRAEVREQITRELQHEAKAMTRFNAHPAMSDAAATATAYREGIRDGLTAAARIARQEQP